MSARRAGLLAALLALGGMHAARAQEASPLDLATYPRTELTVQAAGPPRATHRFRVWVADTPARAAQGLMFVRDLPESEGMVFPLVPPRVETMWMKNTYIELDMLFVGSDGRVVKVLEHAVPLSLTTLSSDVPVAAVVELRGGAVQHLHLQRGDRVSWEKPGS
ncbi:MAG: DUF192 domain-containing protein [Gammaproteobacteria bacterium]|nr:DUF192 domain-containing protein [Gammaproteobacteria bacterium]